jgi:hypothetical protein
MPFTNIFYQSHVAQGWSDLTEIRTNPIGPNYSNSKNWLTQFLLNTTFSAPMAANQRALEFAILRRAEGAAEDFDGAWSCLHEFLSERTCSRYFRALRKLETVIAQVYQAFEFIRIATSKRFFEPNDNTHYERLGKIYNIGRHGRPLNLPDGHMQLVWITNEGINIDGSRLSFDELRELVAELAEAANKIASGFPQPQGPAPNSSGETAAPPRS